MAGEKKGSVRIVARTLYIAIDRSVLVAGERARMRMACQPAAITTQ